MIRPSLRFLPFASACLVAVACGKDSNSNTSPGGTTSTGLTIVIDSVSKNQSAVVGSTITIGFTVMNATVTAGVANQVVTFTPQAGSGSVAPSSATSDANGHATASWTLGTTSGAVTLAIATTGVTVNATATALAASPTKLIKISVDSQTVVASASAALVVRSADQFGNPVPNIPVNWSANGGTLTPLSTTTGASGNAVVTFTTGVAPAQYSITATSPGLTSVTFTLTGG